MKPTMDEINVGDGIYFEHPFINNHGLLWTVASKSDNVLSLKIDDGSVKDNCFMDIEYIQRLEKRTV